MKVLIYWHDIFLPYSEYLIEALNDNEHLSKVIIAGPCIATSEEIFAAGKFSDKEYLKVEKRILQTYKARPKWATLKSFRLAIREHKPDLIIVLDEALSVNVFNAGLANRLERNNAKVLFYGFENISQKVPWDYLRQNFGVSGVANFLRKSFRYICFDYLLHPIRKRVVDGGLYCYQECGDIVRNFGWNPPMKEQWWGLQLEKFYADRQLTDVSLMRATINIPVDVKVVGFVGRFISDKGILDLLYALKGIGNVHLLLIGAGPLHAQIKIVANELGISDRIHVLPPKTQEDLALLYRVMDMLVLPSRTGWFWKEQYGRVLVEAMACGITVIGSSSGAIPTVIGDARYVFEEGNIKEIQSAILNGIKYPQSKELLVQRSKAGGIAKFVDTFISLAREISCT